MVVEGNRRPHLRTRPRIFRRVPDNIEDIGKQLPKEWLTIAKKSYRNWAELWHINRVGLGIERSPDSVTFTKTDQISAFVVLKCPATNRYTIIGQGQTGSCTQLEEDTVHVFVLKFMVERRKVMYLSREALVELRTGPSSIREIKMRTTTQRWTTTISTKKRASRPNTTVRRSKIRFVKWGKEPARLVHELVTVAEPLLKDPEDLDHQKVQPLKIKTKSRPSVRGEEWEIEAFIGIIGASMLSLAALGTVSCFILWHHLNKRSNERVTVQFPLRRIERDVIR